MADVPAVQISTQWTTEGVVVTALGEIDPLRAPVLGATFDALVESGHREVVLDLAAVTFADASCLGTIAAAARRFHAVDGVFLVRAPRPMARRLLALTELDGFIEAPTRDVATFRANRSARARPPDEDDAPTGEVWVSDSARAEHAGQLATRVSGFLADGGADVSDESVAPRLLGALQTRAVIAQAQGVIMERYGVSAETAFVALRRSSEARGERIGVRAGEIVALTLREDLIGEVRI